MTIPERTAATTDLELLKFQLERTRFRTDVLKWIVIAIGAVVSFAVIDYGKLRLERSRALADAQRQLLQAYLTATESPQPDVWKRKLHVLETFADDERMGTWVQAELLYIENFAALDALYRETVRVASKLVDVSRLNDSARIAARARYEELYWADLPFAKESKEVEAAMVQFRRQLSTAEEAPNDKQAWSSLNILLINLSEALRESMPVYQRRPALPGTPQNR
jgi:hypothetical protein